MSKKGKVLLVVFMVGVVLPTLFQKTGRTDLGILYLAGERLFQGESVYRLSDANEHTKPPLVTLLILPLTYFPQFWVERLWDVLQFIAYFTLCRLFLEQVQVPKTRRANLVLLATFLFLTPLNAELRLGQYNVLFLTLVLWAVWGGRSFSAGGVLALSILFKPTFLFFAPWVARHCVSWKRAFIGAVAAVLILAGAYGLLFGGPRLIQDTLDWAAFLPESSAKHLLRFDNHGFPSVFGGNSILTPNVFLAAGLLLATLAAAWLPSLLGLACASACFVLFTPMAWFQNYALLTPWIYWVAQRWDQTEGVAARLYLVAASVLWFGIGFLNPTTCHWLECQNWGIHRFPLWCLLGALVFFFFASLVSKKHQHSRKTA